MHRRPLATATTGLRSAVSAEGCRVEVSQRLKRAMTIIDKLDREPTMALANMQDIGGCRAVLDTIEEVRKVQQRISRRRGRVQRTNDYISGPRKSGYRGVHLIVQYHGHNIEIQLRTRVMHDWAIAVERLSGRLDVDLKSAKGPPEVLAWLEEVSNAMRLEEEGRVVDTELADRIGELREAAFKYLEGGRG